jgi:hypothetical protein
MTEEAGKRKRGRPAGIPREGRYGTGVKTRTVRVPETVADNIADILKSFDDIKSVVDSWDGEVASAALRSAKGKPSPRYEKAMEILKELRGYLGD